MAYVSPEPTKNRYINSTAILLTIVTLLAFLMRIYWAFRFQLTGDEAYYYLWSQHLDYAYHDHPAGIAWLIFLSSSIFGPSKFGIRFLNSLLGALTCVLAYKLAMALTNSKASALATCCVFAFAPFMVLFGIFAFPDSLMLFLFLLTLLVWFETTFQGRSTKITILPTILFLNTKYNSYLVVLALVGSYFWLNRKTIRSKDIWPILGIFALGLLPVLVWNSFHDWSSFHWQVDHFINGVGPNKSLFEEIGSIITFYSLPTIVLSIMGVLSLKKGKQNAWLVLIGLFYFVPFFLSALDSARNMSMAFIPWLIASSSYVEMREHVSFLSHLRKRFWNNITSLVVVLLVTIITASGFISSFTGFQALPDPIRADYDNIVNDGIGIKDIALQLKHVSFNVLVTPNYDLAGKLQYFMSEYSIYTNWQQFWYWGISLEENLTVVAYSDQWSSKLASLCSVLSPVEQLVAKKGNHTVSVFYWNCYGRNVTTEQFMSELDYLSGS
ncbi:MAG: ArnT family glycosyltransferase [Candidatus Heimdallarchaeota archaeon]